MVDQSAPANDAAGAAEEVFVDVVADAQPAEPAQQGDGLLDDPAMHAQARAMSRVTAGDHGSDPGLADLLAVLVVVIAAVGIDLIRALARPSAATPRGRDGLDKGRS